MAKKETKQERGRRLLNSDWSQEELSDVGVLELRQKLEEEKKIEEARRKANFDNVDSGVTVGMSLDSYGRPQGTWFIEPKAAPKEDFGRWDAFNSSRRGSNDITEAAFIQDELGDLETKYGTPEQRSAARARYEEERARGLMDRSTFSMAANAAKELGRISQAEALFSNPEKVEATKAKMQELKARGQAQSQAAENFFKDNDAYLTRTAADMYNSRLSALPLATGLAAGAVGGYLSGGTLAGPAAAAGSAVGALPGANQARAVAYAEAKDAGMPEEDARQFSMVMAGSDFVLSALGQGGAALMSSVVKQEIKKRVTTSLMKKVLTTVPKQVGLGAGEEALTSGLQAGIRATYAQNEEFSKATRDYLAQTAHVNPDGTVDWSAAVADMARSAAAGGVTTATLSTPVETFVIMKEMGKQASNLQEYLANQGYKKEADDIAKAAKKPVFREPVQEDMFGGRGEIPITEEGRTASDVGTDTDGIQARLRTQADTVRAQLEADRERLAGFQTRIERAPFAEDQADLLTNQERTDMSRIQERVAGQEKLLAELEAQQTPTQLGLNLQEKNQPKNPKFTGQERTVDQIKSDYFKTQPVQGPQNMTPAQRKAVQKDITEELKRTKAEQKKANDKIKAARAAARRKFLDGQRAGLLDLPVEERAKRLAEAGREWDTANPLVLPTQATQTAAKPAAAPAEAQEAEASVPVSTLTEGLQGTPEGTVPLPSTAQAPAQGTTLEDVRKAVGGGKRDKLASRLSYMVEDGNLEIVESQDQIPGDIGEMEAQGSGWYDPNTGKSYIVASNLNPENIRGDILSALAHETKHGGDFGGSKGLARSFKPFIGSKANKEMVEKIKKAAKAGDTSAKFALRAVLGDEQNQDNKTVYQELDHTEDQVNSEIVANYLTAEHKKSGVKTSLYRGIVSPLRVGAKKLLGSNDVSLGDIHYMADRLVNEVAQRGERIKPSGGKALPMTISGGRTEAEQIRNNRTWLSADKGRKYEISDKDSSVEIPGDYMDRDFKAKEILKHDKLYNELPELADTTIRFAELDPSTGGQYSKEDNVITINTATNEFKRGRNMYNGLIHQYILHEMQHRAQGVSGTTPGASPTYFLPNEAKRLENDIEDLAFAINYGESTGADADFLERQRQEMSQKEQEYLQKYGPNTPAYEAATIQYEKVLGELEAYRTNNNLTKTEAELDETGLGQQEVQWDKEEGITTETGKRIRPTTRPRQKAAAMPSVAEDYVPRELPVARTITRTAKLKDGTEVELSSKPGKWEGTVEIIATVGGKEVGSLDATTAEQEGMRFNPHAEVDSAWRRKGLASAMYDLAEEAGALIPHMSQKGQVRTPDGEAFRQAREAKKAKPMPSVAEQSEKDNRSWWNKRKDSSAALRVVSHLLSTTEGLDGELFKLFTDRQGNRADLALRAQEAGSHAENSLRKAAEVSGKSLKQVTREVKSQLSEINKMPNRSDREAAVKALDKNYPGLGIAMTNLRNLKWSLSRAVIEQRIKQGEDLSAKENATHEAIIKNAETYITRAYMSNQLPGKEFAKRRLSDIKKNPQGEEAIQYDRAVQFLMDRHLVIPTSEELATKSDTAIRALYEQWVGDSSGVEVADMAKALDSIPRKSKEVYRAKAEKIAKELMGTTRTKGRVTNSYSGARQNRTILEGRENVPAEIRFLMGEIVNPIAAELMTVARLSSLYTQTKMLEGMVEGGKDKWYKDYQDGDFNTLLKDDSYGPMKGKWVTPTAAKFLEPSAELGASIEQVLNPANKDLGRMVAMIATAGIRAMRSTTSVVKLADLVTSPVAMAWNYIGAYQIAMQNGVFDPRDWAKAQGATRRAIEAHKNPSKFTKEQLEESQELVRVGVMDSATVGEFQQSFFDSMFRLLEDEQDINAVRIKAERLVKDGVIDAKDLYAFMDMWAKVAAYYNRRDYLIKFNEAEGGKLTQDQVKRKAGFEITSSNTSYTRAFKFIKLAEQNLPAFTMYLTYFSEVPRGLVASSFLAYTDLKQAANAKTSKGRNLALSAGLRRAAGTLMSTAVLSTLVTMYLNSLDEDEKRRRKTDPEWEAKGVPVKIGEDKEGKPLFINILRADANGPWNEFVVNMSTLEEDEDIGDALMKTIKSQFVEAKPIKDTFRLIRGLAGKETYNNDDGFGDFADSLDDMSWGKDENLGRNFMSVLEGFTPKIIKGSYRSANGTIGKRKHEFNPSENLRAAAFQAAGGTLYVRDPEFSLEIATGAYKKQKSEAAKELNGMKGKLGRMDGKALIDKLSDVVEDERKAYQSLYDVYDGTKAFNGYYTDKDYTKAAKKILTAEELGPAEDDVVNGAFNVRFISKDYINAWRDARTEKIKEMEPNKKSKAAAQLRQDYKMVVDYLGMRE